MPNKVQTLEPSTIETIDLGIYEYVNEKLNLQTLFVSVVCKVI